MNKAIEKGADYVTKEHARVTNMLSSESITKAKKSDLMLRANVLSAFKA